MKLYLNFNDMFKSKKKLNGAIIIARLNQKD